MSHDRGHISRAKCFQWVKLCMWLWNSVLWLFVISGLYCPSTTCLGNLQMLSIRSLMVFPLCGCCVMVMIQNIMRWWVVTYPDTTTIYAILFPMSLSRVKHPDIFWNILCIYWFGLFCILTDRTKLKYNSVIIYHNLCVGVCESVFTDSDTCMHIDTLGPVFQKLHRINEMWEKRPSCFNKGKVSYISVRQTSLVIKLIKQCSTFVSFVVVCWPLLHRVPIQSVMPSTVCTYEIYVTYTFIGRS